MTAGSSGLPAAAPTAMLSISTPGLELVGLRANRPDDKLHRSRYALVSKRAQALDLGIGSPGWSKLAGYEASNDFWPRSIKLKLRTPGPFSPISNTSSAAVPRFRGPLAVRA